MIRSPAKLTAALAVLLASQLACAVGELSGSSPGDGSAISVQLDPQQLARAVTIYRDGYGVPHIDGADDASTVFGFAYAQAEDHFWQVEDSYILALGRYAEVHGSKGLNSDLLNRAFEIVPTSKADYGKLPTESQRLCEAFTSGLNYYLATNPGVKPRLIQRFEPWHVLAFARHITLELCFRYTRLSSSYLPRSNALIEAAIGSNAWAIGPKRTASGNAMLFINPHQPWFGFGQMYEAHLRSGEGWNFTGATFFGSVLPGLGHNEHLGWGLTTNEPDIADVWRVTFDDPQNRLNYRYDGGYRTAVEWKEAISIATPRGITERVYTLRKTHHGPIVGREDDQNFLAAQIANLYHTLLLRQGLAMIKARNLTEFKAALTLCQVQYMNVIYADRDGNIFYIYNGVVPRRNSEFDWRKPVDGGNPATAWQGFHTTSELPQVLNPPCGFIQNCNSTPFMTSDDGNPNRQSFPPYMIEEHDDDKRRAKRSRQLLRAMKDIKLLDLKQAAFDTGVHWAMEELPRYGKAFAELEKTYPELAEQVAPYLEHLLAWDCYIREDSTAATLCQAWYEELYGLAYPGETLKPQFVDNFEQQFKALLYSARRLEAIHGSWQVPWGQVHRMQRRAETADLLSLAFNETEPSLSSLGAHGPMGVIFTQYNTPSLTLPFVKPRKSRFGLIGSTYMAVFEFGERVSGSTVLNFGQSGDPTSPHYFDQAALLSERRMKPSLFYWEEVLANTERAYHPGEKPQPMQARLELPK